MKVLVIGGRGHIGQQAVRGLRALKNTSLDILIGSRAEAPGGVVVDLRQPGTFEAMRGFDLIINCADTVTAPPDDAMRFCLAEGLTFIETASEPAMVRRVLDTLRPDMAPPTQLAQIENLRGVVVMGAGIFTGLSNLLAAEVLKRGGENTKRLELGIRWSPISAGGGGMVNLVGHLLGVPTVRYDTHEGEARAIFGPPAEAGPALPFAAQGFVKTLHLPFAESTMLRWSTRAPEVAVYGALRPGFLLAMFLMFPLWLMQTRVMKFWLWLQFTMIRRVFLRWYHSSVEMVAVARDANNQPLSIGRLQAEQGMSLAGGAIGAQAEYLLAHKPHPGLYMIDECISLNDIFDRASKLTLTKSALSFEG